MLEAAFQVARLAMICIGETKLLITLANRATGLSMNLQGEQ